MFLLISTGCLQFCGVIQARQSANGGSIREPGVEWDFVVKIHNRRCIAALAPLEPPRKTVSSLALVHSKAGEKSSYFISTSSRSCSINCEMGVLRGR